MVQRRERIKKQLLQMQLERLELEANLPLHHTQTEAAPTVNVSTVDDRSSSELENSSDVEVDIPLPRQTRCA